MNYEDLFPRPITEMTDEEIIARAAELREKNNLVKFSSTKEKTLKAPKLVTGKTKPLSKAEQAMQAILDLAQAKKAEKEAANEETSNTVPSPDTPS